MSNPTIDYMDENGFDPGVSDGRGALSPAGRSRCEAMLPALQAAVVRHGTQRRRRQSMIRAAGATALLVAVGFGLTHIPWPSESVTRVAWNGAPNGRVEVPTETESQSKWLITIVEIDPGALSRHIVDPSADPAEYIVDDRELVATLAAIGRPAGLIRSGESIRLTAAVTDAECKPAASPPLAPSPSVSPAQPPSLHLPGV